MTNISDEGNFEVYVISRGKEGWKRLRDLNSIRYGVAALMNNS
jgi:hypothetical protein